MSGLGIILIILGLPLLIYNLISEKKNQTWQNLGLIFLAFGVVIIIVGVVAGDGDNSEVNRPTAEKTYEVTKSTYLYYEVDIDSDSNELLSEGQIVKPYPGSTLQCEKINDEVVGVIELCRVKVEKTGSTGWVLRQWIR